LNNYVDVRERTTSRGYSGLDSIVANNLEGKSSSLLEVSLSTERLNVAQSVVHNATILAVLVNDGIVLNDNVFRDTEGNSGGNSGNSLTRSPAEVTSVNDESGSRITNENGITSRMQVPSLSIETGEMWVSPERASINSLRLLDVSNGLVYESASTTSLAANSANDNLSDLSQTLVGNAPSLLDNTSQLPVSAAKTSSTELDNYESAYLSDLSLGSSVASAANSSGQATSNTSDDLDDLSLVPSLSTFNSPYNVDENPSTALVSADSSLYQV
jgi:hypothetical protein